MREPFRVGGSSPFQALNKTSNEGENRQVWSSGHHLKSCRDVAFSQDGQKLFTVSKDKSIHILTVEEGRLETRFPKAHGSALNCVLPIDNHVFATGDDDGGLKVWDLRKGDAILEARQQEEYISAMAVDGNGKILLTASGDGTLGVFNVKRRRFDLVSEPQNGDLTSVVLLKRGKKVACGSSEGTIYLFNWDGFGAASDRFALRAESVDCMVPITDSIVCVGSLDGVIRAVNVLPNRVLGCVGQHLGEPIEQLAGGPGLFNLVCAPIPQLAQQIWLRVPQAALAPAAIMFLAWRISSTNSISTLGEMIWASVEEAAHASCTDQHISNRFLKGNWWLSIGSSVPGLTCCCTSCRVLECQCCRFIACPFNTVMDKLMLESSSIPIGKYWIEIYGLRGMDYEPIYWAMLALPGSGCLVETISKRIRRHCRFTTIIQLYVQAMPVKNHRMWVLVTGRRQVGFPGRGGPSLQGTR
ncbi:PREDICTED: WD repeat-containing protein 55 [Charadrius vociferus]|uniref:WD repeat-containing protein 55 n=1 Tax=Charadrius vociferus TaxID=50402 RepID=UPI0005213B38|nr:PREDICTED: WD repeat-containing protein 55 [Charadrius vociferus]